MSETALETIKRQISENPILLYMKGSPQAPQCGFSAKTIECMVGCGQRFAYVDILSNPEIRATLPSYAEWPTFPQLWVDGELVGGCDIVTEMFESGELQALLSETTERQTDSEDLLSRQIFTRVGVKAVPSNLSVMPKVDYRAE